MIFQVMLAVALFGHSQAAEETVGRPTISLDLDAMTTPPRAYTTTKAGVPCWCADVSVCRCIGMSSAKICSQETKMRLPVQRKTGVDTVDVALGSSHMWTAHRHMPSFSSVLAAVWPF